jgi:molybdopterin-guanine dinucleotide biosynthesis protein A
VSGVVLAGGQGRRMGTVDKGLVALHGRSMVRHVLDRFAPQVDDILINANQNLDRYAALGFRVVPDSIEGFAGPLAGLHVGLTHATQALVATVPCDSPFLPADLVARLLAALQKMDAELAVLPHLTRFLEGGGRKIDAWYATLKTIEVAFDDEADAFRNINTSEELNQAHGER